MRPHEKLDVWKMSVDMVVKVYECTKTFPSEEKFGLTSQNSQGGSFNSGKYRGRCWSAV
ncbi:MAG: four helix bundle protein [Pyrinomonadaceae bacterium]